MSIGYNNFFFYTIKLAPIILLYVLVFTELETEFGSYLSYFSFNLQMIVVYFWVLKKPYIMGNGHIFIAGLVNDFVLGLPLGTTPIVLLILSLVTSYIRVATLRSKIITAWFAFIPAIFLSNLAYILIITNFTEITIPYIKLIQNSFFTFLFFPIFYQIFNTFLTFTGSHDS